MIAIPFTAAPYQRLTITLEERLVRITLRYGALNDAWTFDMAEDGVDLVRGQRVVLQTDMLRGHALKLGGLVAVATHDVDVDPAGGDFPDRVTIYHVTEAEAASLASS